MDVFLEADFILGLQLLPWYLSQGVVDVQLQY